MNKEKYGTIEYYQEEEKKAKMTFDLLYDAIRKKCANQLRDIDSSFSECKSFDKYEEKVMPYNDDLITACKCLIEAKETLDMYKQKIKELSNGESV